MENYSYSRMGQIQPIRDLKLNVLGCPAAQENRDCNPYFVKLGFWSSLPARWWRYKYFWPMVRTFLHFLLNISVDPFLNIHFRLYGVAVTSVQTTVKNFLTIKTPRWSFFFGFQTLNTFHELWVTTIDPRVNDIDGFIIRVDGTKIFILTNWI